MAEPAQHCQRRWWQRPPVWFIGIAAVAALVIGVAVELSDRSAPMPYSAFLDQLDAGNVASVTFRGTEISGRLKRPLEDKGIPGGTAQRDTFNSYVPDVGDPALVPALHKQRVEIEVSAPSAWTWLLGRVPFPILIFLGVIVVAGVIRLVRGSKPVSGSPMSMHPMGGMVGLLSGIFARQDQQVTLSKNEDDAAKARPKTR
jgi:hypothetical protein